MWPFEKNMNFCRKFGFWNLRSFPPFKVHIWTIWMLFSIEEYINGPYETHVSGRKSGYRPPVSIILERVLIYGPQVSLFLERVLIYWPQSVHISGKSISLYFGCLNLYFGCLNLYRCTSGVWAYTLGVWTYTLGVWTYTLGVWYHVCNCSSGWQSCKRY